MNIEKQEEPIVTKSLLGDMWKVEHGNITKFMNQKRMEEYLEQIKNDKGQK